MKHNWSILCKNSTTDSINNTLSLTEILERLTINLNISKVSKLPDSFVIPFEFELVSMILDMPDKKNVFIKIELFNSHNEKMGGTENKLDVPKGTKNLRSRVIFNSIKIKGEGIYMFKIFLKEEKKDTYSHVADVPLEVIIAK